MSDSFKEFLSDCEKTFFKTWGKNKITIGQWVYWQTCLGEWAYKKYLLEKESYVIAQKEFKNCEITGAFGGQASSKLEIAFACLGRKEVEKRLKRLRD